MTAMPLTRAHELIETLKLQPHPEGGWYGEVFRSASSVTPTDGRAPRSALTSIYFLLEASQHSRWHRVLSDEVWVHLEGVPLTLWTCDAAMRTARVPSMWCPPANGKRPGRSRATVQATTHWSPAWSGRASISPTFRWCRPTATKLRRCGTIGLTWPGCSNPRFSPGAA